MLRSRTDAVTSARFRWQKKEVRMRGRTIAILSAACLATGMAWAADSSFIGDWKLDPSRSHLPDEMKVDGRGGNTYAFDFGGGAETIRVDGTGQPGQGGTLLSVKPVAPDRWIVQRRKDGRLQIEATWMLSKDGATLTDRFRGLQPDGSPLSIDYVYRRKAAGSGFAADWQSIHETMNSPLSLQVKALEGDGLAFVTPSQRTTRIVRPDGKDYATPGAPAGAGTSSSARHIDERTLMITNKAGGNVTDTREIALSADRKTLTITVHISGRDRPNVLVFARS
jgi:hypothetical protein